MLKDIDRVCGHKNEAPPLNSTFVDSTHVMMYFVPFYRLRDQLLT